MESKMSSGAGPDKRMRFEVAMAEVAQSQLRARYYEQRITTGAWRERIGKVYLGGLPEHGGVPMAEDEILHDEVQTMNRHIQIAEDRLGTAKSLLLDRQTSECGSFVL